MTQAEFRYLIRYAKNEKISLDQELSLYRLISRYFGIGDTPDPIIRARLDMVRQTNPDVARLLKKIQSWRESLDDFRL